MSIVPTMHDRLAGAESEASFYKKMYDEAVKELSSLKAENERLKDALGKAMESLQFSVNGCLVPPDGGSPDVNDHINNAKEALTAIEKVLGDEKC